MQLIPLSVPFKLYINSDISEIHLAIINTFFETIYWRMICEWKAKSERDINVLFEKS